MKQRIIECKVDIALMPESTWGSFCYGCVAGSRASFLEPSPVVPYVYLCKGRLLNKLPGPSGVI